MIEVISEERCINCDICVRVCPTNVFDPVPDSPPVIARQEDCQTCFMCELYCPVDALFVAPQAEESVTLEEAQLVRQGLLGGYRAVVGWGEGRAPGAARDRSSQLLGSSSPPAEHPTATGSATTSGAWKGPSAWPSTVTPSPLAVAASGRSTTDPCPRPGGG